MKIPNIYNNFYEIITFIFIIALSLILNVAFGQTIAKGKIISETPVTGYILQTDDFGNSFYSPWDGWTHKYKGYIDENEIVYLLFTNETDTANVVIYGNAEKLRIKQDIELTDKLTIINKPITADK